MIAFSGINFTGQDHVGGSSIPDKGHDGLLLAPEVATCFELLFAMLNLACFLDGLPFAINLSKGGGVGVWLGKACKESA